MKKTIILSAIFLLITIFTDAQVISLSKVPNETPNGSYLKDLDNTFPFFTGTWAADFEGNRVILNISNKIEDYPVKILDSNYYSDVLFIRYKINDPNGNQLVTTMNKEVTNSNIISTFTSPDKTKIGFYYNGEECGIGNGSIMLTKIDDSHFRWEYHSLRDIIDPNRCPEYTSSIKSYIPRSLDLVFTKQ